MSKKKDKHITYDDPNNWTYNYAAKQEKDDNEREEMAMSKKSAGSTVNWIKGAVVGVLNGGNFHDCYIHLPQMAGEGQPFIAQFVNDARNPESLRGKTLRTSPIQSVHAMRMQEQELEL